MLISPFIDHNLRDGRYTKGIIIFVCRGTDSAGSYSAGVGVASGCSDGYGMELRRILSSLGGRLYDLPSWRLANV